MKSSGLAVILSFFWTGLGQIYNGHIGKGLFMIVLQIINAALMLVLVGFVTYFIVWVWGLYDAYQSAERINASYGR